MFICLNFCFFFHCRTLLALGSEWLQDTNPTQSAALKVQVERKWLHSAKVARKSGHTQQGEWALLGAGKSIHSFSSLFNIFLSISNEVKWTTLHSIEHDGMTK